MEKCLLDLVQAVLPNARFYRKSLKIHLLTLKVEAEKDGVGSAFNLPSSGSGLRKWI